MDYSRILRELYAQRDNLDRVIKQLESLENGSSLEGGTRKRGRKSMGPEERKIVSERIRKYWAEKRRGKK